VTQGADNSFVLGNALFYMSRNRPADIQYIKMIMQSWHHANLSGTMREFLVSFRRTVAMGTLVPISMSGLQKGETLPLVEEGGVIRHEAVSEDSWKR
jgi:hypothetical protein